MLNEDQAAGRTCCYCPLSFGRLDPVQAPAGVAGVMFLAAHPSCIGPHHPQASCAPKDGGGNRPPGKDQR